MRAIILAIIFILAVIFENWVSLWKSVNTIMQSKELSFGSVIALFAPFFIIWVKVSKEKEKKARAKLIERRQMQIAFNINELMEKLGVDSKWNLQEIGSTRMVQPKSKLWFLFSQVVTIQRRIKIMQKLYSRKFWLTILAALIPVINKEFDINLDLPTMIMIVTALMSGVAALAHVDAKKVLATIKRDTQTIVQRVEADPLMTYEQIMSTVKSINADINAILRDIQKKDGSDAYKNAVSAYLTIAQTLDSLKEPLPLEVPDAGV